MIYIEKVSEESFVSLYPPIYWKKKLISSHIKSRLLKVLKQKKEENYVILCSVNYMKYENEKKEGKKK